MAKYLKINADCKKGKQEKLIVFCLPFIFIRAFVAKNLAMILKIPRIQERSELLVVRSSQKNQLRFAYFFLLKIKFGLIFIPTKKLAVAIGK